MQRYFGLEKIDNKFILRDDDIYHIKTVMRMQDNDTIEVVFDKKVYECCLVNVKSNIEILIEKELQKKSKNEKFVNLIIPILKENKLDLILQKATEMGVYQITIIPMKRCVIRADEGKINKKIDRWNRIVKEASEQSKRVEIPKIDFLKNLKKLEKCDGLNLVCSTREHEKSIKRVLTKNKNCDRINLVIGPEGGFDETEEKYLVDLGYEPITLGDRIMRVETVPLFLMSVIDYEYME